MFQNPQINNLLGMAQGAGLLDIAMQGYNAYRNGKLQVFAKYQYDNNPNFKKFYDENKNKTFEQFLNEKGIEL